MGYDATENTKRAVISGLDTLADTEEGVIKRASDARRSVVYEMNSAVAKQLLRAIRGSTRQTVLAPDRARLGLAASDLGEAGLGVHRLRAGIEVGGALDVGWRRVALDQCASLGADPVDGGGRAGRRPRRPRVGAWDVDADDGPRRLVVDGLQDGRPLDAAELGTGRDRYPADGLVVPPGDRARVPPRPPPAPAWRPDSPVPLSLTPLSKSALRSRHHMHQQLA